MYIYILVRKCFKSHIITLPKTVLMLLYHFFYTRIYMQAHKITEYIVVSELAILITII